MSDIVNCLRKEDPECGLRHSIAMEAADRIEALESALSLLIEQADALQFPTAMIKDARAALGEKKDDSRS